MRSPEKTSHKPRRKRRPDFVRRFTNWARHEPEPEYCRGLLRPPFIRHFVNDHKVPGEVPVERSDVDHEIGKIGDQGGADLYGVYLLLLIYAGDRSYLRGYLLNPDDQPARADEIACRILIVPPSKIKRAVRDLEKIGLIERVPLDEVREEIRLATAEEEPED